MKRARLALLIVLHMRTRLLNTKCWCTHVNLVKIKMKTQKYICCTSGVTLTQYEISDYFTLDEKHSGTCLFWSDTILTEGQLTPSTSGNLFRTTLTRRSSRLKRRVYVYVDWREVKYLGSHCEFSTICWTSLMSLEVLLGTCILCLCCMPCLQLCMSIVNC